MQLGTLSVETPHARAWARFEEVRDSRRIPPDALEGVNLMRVQKAVVCVLGVQVGDAQIPDTTLAYSFTSVRDTHSFSEGCLRALRKAFFSYNATATQSAVLKAVERKLLGLVTKAVRGKFRYTGQGLPTVEREAWLKARSGRG